MSLVESNSSKPRKRMRDDCVPEMSLVEWSSSKPRKSMRDDCVPDGDLLGFIDALSKIMENAISHEKMEKTIRRVTSEVRVMLDDAKFKFKEERREFAKALLKNSEQCENSLKSDFVKFQASHEELCEEKATYLQAFQDIFSKFEVEKEKILARYEQQCDETAFAELEKACTVKITALGESLKEMQQVDNAISLLFKYLHSCVKKSH